MISIITCSLKPELLQQMQQSVAATIGVDHEWCVWDNRVDNTGICAVYNRMATRARFPYLVFLHEDIIFQTRDWGNYLIGLLEKPETGMVGIGGGVYKSAYLSGWYVGGPNTDFSNIRHRLGEHEYSVNYGKWTTDEKEVVTLDGVFLACRKEVWEQTKFDEQNLRGFHFYDIDISLRIAQNWKVLVTRKIDIVHLTTGGDFGDRWVSEAMIYHRANKDRLPFSKKPVDQPALDLVVARSWLDALKNQNIKVDRRMQWITEQGLFSQPRLWYAIARFLAYRPLRLAYIHRLFKRKK